MAKDNDIEKLVNEALDCKQTIEVRKAVHIFCGVIEQLFTDKNGVFAHIQEELGNRVMKSMFYSLIGSYVGSVYTSAMFDGDLEGAIEFAKQKGINEVRVETKEGTKDVSLEEDETRYQA